MFSVFLINCESNSSTLLSSSDRKLSPCLIEALVFPDAEVAWQTTSYFNVHFPQRCARGRGNTWKPTPASTRNKENDSSRFIYDTELENLPSLAKHGGGSGVLLISSLSEQPMGNLNLHKTRLQHEFCCQKRTDELKTHLSGYRKCRLYAYICGYAVPANQFWFTHAAASGSR